MWRLPARSPAPRRCPAASTARKGLPHKVLRGIVATSARGLPQL